MAQPLTADDLLPLVAKLPRDEQLRVAHLALRAAREASRDAGATPGSPARSDAPATDPEPASSECEGWEDAESHVAPR